MRSKHPSLLPIIALVLSIALAPSLAADDGKPGFEEWLRAEAIANVEASISEGLLQPPAKAAPASLEGGEKSGFEKMSIFNCIPSCDATDGRLLVIANGPSFVTLSDPILELQVQVPAGTTSFELGVFDGDGSEGGAGSFWDLGAAAPFTYTLRADPFGDGTGTDIVEMQAGSPFISSSTLPNNAWQDFTIVTSAAAQSPSGNFFYRLTIELTNLSLNTLNGFKVRTNAVATIEPFAQPFSYIANWTSGNDLFIIYPAFPNASPTTYDGDFQFFFRLPGDQTELVIWGGDFDRGRFDGAESDTDDLDTPIDDDGNSATPFPPWNTVDGRPEGVATGFGASTGNPPDDGETNITLGPFTGPYLIRTPSVEFDVVFPNGLVVENPNPSGNQEWEQFVISSDPACDSTPSCVPTGAGPGENRFGFPCADVCIATPVPAGIYELRIRGVDMQNLNALQLPEPLVCVGDLGEACETLKPFELGDTVFFDQDGNGLQDPGDTGIQGVIVEVLNEQGQIQASAVTDANGNYLFPTSPGTFTVRVSDKNFVAPTAAGAVGDRVWLDADGDGTQGAGEPGIANAKVFVFDVGANGIPGDADDLFYTASRTDRNGNYLVGDLPPGTYYAQVDESSLPAGLSLTGGSNPSSTRTITAGEVFLGLDFGYGNGATTASIGDFVWSDADGDGTQDPSEPGIAGVTLALLDAASTVVATATTRADGTYLFSGLAPGTYTVDVTDTAGVLAGYGLTTGPQSNTDPSAPITVAGGDVFLGADFGYDNPGLPDVTDVVWFDADRDGTLDAGESGLANVTVSLLDAAGRIIASTITDSNGTFTFTGVTPGDYFLKITDLGSVVAGFLPTTNGALSTRHALTVVGSNVSGINFGYIDSGALEGLTGTTLKAPNADFDAQVDTIANDNIFDYDFGYSVPASVGDRVWQDDGDGVQEIGEPGINGVTVRLLDSTGNEVATTTTSGDGNYSFTGLRPGTYTVEVVTSTLPAGLDIATFDLDGGLDGRTEVTLAPGDARTDVDFGYRGDGSIGDRLWEDENGDDVQDAGEPGVNGVTVRLLDAGGNEIASAVTSGDGNYLFAGLPAGAYTVVVDGSTVPASLAQTFDLDGTLDNRASVALGPSEDRSDVDFGYGRVFSTLGDRVWLDQNGDGVQDAGEPGINGLLVTLLDGSGNPVATQVTSIDGNYRFFQLLPDTYTVTVDTGPLTGLVPTFDLDGLGTPNAAARVLGSAENPVDVDFGYNGDTILCAEEAIRDPDLLQFPGFDGHAFWLPGIGTDFIFDPNSGVLEIRDDGTATLSGIIRRSSSSLEAFDVLIEFGDYSGPAPPGSPIEELDPGAYVPTGPIDSKTFFYYDSVVGLLTGVDDFQGAVLEVAKNSDAGFQVGFGANGKNGNYGASSWLAVTVTQQPDSGVTLAITDRGDINIDLIACPLGSIGDRVWEDLNGDGAQDAGEAGINGVTVRLLDDEGNLVATAVTSGDGNYSFDNLLPGDYTVEIDRSTLPAGLDEATFDADGTLDDRSDVMLAPGENRTDIDFGYRGSGSIGDRVWQDTDGDGVQDAGETGINGVTVRLLDAGGNEIATTVTSGDGGYSFDNLPAGDYTVEIDGSTLPAGVDEATFDLDGTLDNRTTLTLGANEDRTDADFGYRPSGSLGDRVWLDDGNGLQDAGEPGINGVTVRLLDSGGNVVATAVTSGDGNYSFDGLPAGDYTVEVDASTLPAGVDTQTFDLDGTLDNRTTVTLAAGQDRSDLDFGYRVGLGTLGDRVWLDLDGNGTQDAGEPGINGATVRLLDSGGNEIGSAVTSGDGDYLFANIPAGTYTVEIDASTLAVDLLQTFDLDGTLDNRTTVVLAPGETNLTVDFGYVSECLPGIDFETDAAGNSLVAGQIIDDEWASLGVHVTTHDPVNHPAMIFDSANPTGGDADLGSPNQSFGGPGVGAGGAAGRPGENSVPLGNVLIISEDGDTSDPDDNGSGGSLIFTFDHPVRVDGIKILDIDEGMAGTVKAFDAAGGMIGSTGMLNNLGNNSVQTLALGFSGVRRLEVTFPGSGSVAALEFCESVCLPNLDFETDGAGTELTTGQIIDDEWAALGITVSTGDPSHPAMIFDSANPTGGDADLGTPNADFGGPGVGSGGAAGAAGENSRDLGKVLILSEDGDSSDPDDNGNGGTLTFTFDREVFLASVEILDIDGPEAMGTVTAFDAGGNPVASADMANLGNNSVQTVTLDALGVRRLEIMFPKSGAVGEIVFCGLCQEIDFDLDGNGNALERGRIIDTEFAAIGMHVTSSNPTSHPAMIFDSSNPTGGDADLGTPNQDFGGPGVGSGGRAGQAGENAVDLGNVLILSEDRDSNDPDDNGSGGTLIFTFDAPVFVESVGILDIDGSEAMGVVRALDGSGNVIASAPMLGLGNNSVQTVEVGASGTERLEVFFPKSGAVSFLKVCGDATKGGGGGGSCAGDISVRDEFNAKSYGNDDGVDSWSGNWVEDDPQGGGPDSGQVRINSNALRLDDYPNTGGQPSASRTVDLSGTTSAIFSFGFDTSIGVDADDAIAVEVSSDGGANWTVLEMLTNLVGEVWEDRSYDISAFISDQTTVRFRVANKYGGSNEFFWADNVQIAATCEGDPNTPPTAYFTVDTSDLELTVHEMSNDPDGQIVEWSWDFGDGQTSGTRSPDHTYDSAGTYTVTLTVTDDDGATQSVSESVTVTAPQGGGCSGCEHFSGWLGNQDWHVQPDGSYYHSSGGVQEGSLEGPANADFDLELYKWAGGGWQRVARSVSYSSSEHIAYEGGEGYYYWAIVSYSGSGDYDFWLDRP